MATHKILADVHASSIGSDGTAKSYTWTVPNTSSNDGHWYKIARVTSAQSQRFKLQMVGGFSYSDGYFASEVNVYGQLNNDDNYDLIFYQLEKSGQANSPVLGFGQVDVDTASTDLYVKLNTFAELAITASVSKGDIYPEATSTSSASEPTNFVAATEQFSVLSEAHFAGNATLVGIIMDGNTITGVDDSGEFTNDDAHIMTSAAIEDKILGYGYSTTTGTVTGTGAANRIAYWASSSQIQSNSGFTFDGTDFTAPGAITGASLDINGNADISGNLSGVDTLTATTLSVTNYGLASGDIPNNAADTTGLAANATNLNASDDRDMAPEDLGYTNDLRIFFSSKEGLEDGSSTGTNYQDVLYLNSYSDSSGGDANILAFDKNEMKIYHYQADQAATNWGTAKELAYTAGPTFTGTPAAPTAGAGTNTTQLATTAFVTTAVSNLIDGAPGALDTLNELAEALNDDDDAVVTLTNSITANTNNITSNNTIANAALPKAGGTMTGNLLVNTATSQPIAITGTNSTYTAIAVKNTGTGDAGVFFDAMNGDLAGSDYAFIGQKEEGELLYDIGVNSTNPVHKFTGGHVGIGITPVSNFHVYQDDTDTGTGSGITVENDGTGDALVQYLLTGAQRWVTGIDNSDSNKFKIASSATLGSNDVLTLDTSGNATFAGTIGSGAITSTGQITGTELEGTSLDINGNADISGALTGVDSIDVSGTATCNALTVAAGITHAGDTNNKIAFTTDVQTFSCDGNESLILRGDAVTDAPLVEIKGAGAGNSLNIGLLLKGNANGNPIKMKMQAPNDSASVTGAGILSYEPDADTFNIGQSTTHNSMAISINNDDHATMTNVVTLSGGFILDGNTITGVNDSGEFDDDDAHIMTSAGVQDKILGYGYTTNTGDATLAGTQTFSGAKTFSAAVTVSNSTASTSKTTGAVKVTGGVGIQGALNVGADVTAFASSDRRYKDNLQAITNPIDKVKSLTGYTFTWNDKHEQFNGNNDIGVVAQEVEKVLPEIVDTRDNGYKAVKYEKMVALLIEAVKDQQKQIDELKEMRCGCSR